MVRDVLHATKALLDPDDPVPDYSAAAVFNFSDAVILNARGKQVINWNSSCHYTTDADGNKIPDLKSRKQACFVACRLTVTAASGGCTVKTPPFHATTLIPLPVEITAGGDQAVPDHVTVGLSQNPSALVTHLKNSAGGTLPNIGKWDEKKSDLFVAANVSGLRSDFVEWVKAVQFELVVPKIKESFVGHLIESVLQNDINKCWQVWYDDKRRIFITLPADQFYEDFIIRMNALTNFGNADLAATFFANHQEDL